MRVTVVGAGIVGLACALRMVEAGHRVRVLATATGAATTSTVAAAIWYPYLAYPRDRVLGWSARGREVLESFAADEASGVRIRAGRQLFREPEPDPWWLPVVPGARRVRGAELPAGYVDGLRLSVPVVDMPRHLDWLWHKLSDVDWVPGKLDDLAAIRDADVLVNATGLGARELVGDASLSAVRGQVVVLRQWGLTEWVLDETDEVNPCYVVPRIDTVVLGGTAHPGDERTEPDERIARSIVDRCAALVPEVADAEIVRHAAGLRPARPSVRLEVEAGAVPVVHCYGHGGAGVTLAYGCAEEVLAAVREFG